MLIVKNERHILFFGDMRCHSDREVFLGAAEYATQCPVWVLNPWPMRFSPSVQPALREVGTLSGVLSNERTLSHAARWQAGLNVPVIHFLAEKPRPEAGDVGIDELAVGEMAAEHLWSRGFRQFAFVGSSRTGWSNKRGEGFERWLAKRGSEPHIHLLPADWLPVFWSENLTGSRKRMQGLLKRLPTPCGIFTANDVIACFVLQAARHAGDRVPEDLEVIGVDNDPLSNAAAGQGISSIELPFREVGRRAARLLEQSWRRPPQPASVRLPPVRVVIQASTGAFMTKDLLVRGAQAFVEARRHRPLTVGEVTRAVGSNRTTLGKRFQRTLRVSLHEYLLRRRIAYASERLSLGDAKVDWVAAECGFSSASYFSRVFTQIAGRRPGSLRPSQRPC
jgi:LacI family transcriptional regulator